MIIDCLVWEKVAIVYDEPVGNDKVVGDHSRIRDDYTRAYISFSSDKSGLSIHASDRSNREFSVLLKNPTLLSITPREMIWSAYYWRSTWHKDGTWTEYPDIRATVTCTF